MERYADLQSRKIARVFADWYCQYTGELSETLFPMYGVLTRMERVVQLDLSGAVLEPFLLPPLVAGLRKAKDLRALDLSGCFDHMVIAGQEVNLAARCVCFILKHVP